ncbi:MAG: sigma-70 family RNA polymerase sigma factor [Chloroflexota bacterium]
MRVPVDAEHADWVERAQRGEVEAFRWLVEAYQVPVFNLCRRMLGDPTEAEDAAQETFLRAFRALQRYDRARPFGTWLLAIASHHCIDALRRRKRFRSSDEGPVAQWDIVDPGDGPEERLARSQSGDEVEMLTRALAPQERAVIVLRYWYDLSYEEIAAALSLSQSAVKSRLHRARRALARRWLEARGGAFDVRGVQNEPSAV